MTNSKKLKNISISPQSGHSWEFRRGSTGEEVVFTQMRDVDGMLLVRWCKMATQDICDFCQIFDGAENQ